MDKISNYKVAMYIRLSREDGDDRESESVDNQRDIIRQFIDNNEDMFLIDEYVDDGYTGTNFDRKDFKRMIEDIESGKINTIITKDLSRFGRDHIDTGYYLERYLPSKDIRYVALGDNIDTNKPDGLNFLTFKLSFNDYYAQDISNKIKSVKRRKAEKGLFQGNTAPYGYKKSPDNKNHLIIDESVEPIIKEMFNLYLEGHTTTDIADLLNERGISSPRSTYRTRKISKRRVHLEKICNM